MRNIELKIGRAPDYVMMIGQTTIMHQVVITVEVAGQSSCEIIKSCKFILPNRIGSGVYSCEDSLCAIATTYKTSYKMRG